MTSFSDLGRNGGQGGFPLSERLILRGGLAAGWSVSVCLSPTFGTFAQVPRRDGAVQGATGHISWRRDR